MNSIFFKPCILGLFILILFTSMPSFAQDPLIMQPYSNPIWLNPAFSGGGKSNSLNTNYRYQWPGLGAPYKTFHAAVDFPFNRINSGIGILFSNDRAGDIIITNTYQISYAYALNLGELVSIRGGVKGGLIHSKLDFSKLTFGDMIDPRRGFIYETNQKPTIKENIIYPDFGVGFLLSAKKLNFGFAVDHINKPNNSHFEESEKLPVKTSIHGSYSMGSDEFSISPYVILKMQSEFYHIISGAYFNRKKVFGGFAYYNTGKTTNGAMISIGINLKYVRIAYGYDIMKINSSLGLPRLGSHEIMLSAFLYNKKERKKIRVAHNPLLSPFSF